MKIFDEKSQKFEEALRESYHDKEHIEVGRLWKVELMRKIRGKDLLDENTTWSFFFNQMGWRFAVVACTLVLMVSVCTNFSGFNTVEEVQNLFLSNPVEFTIAQMLK